MQIIFNGKTYNSIEEMPANEREAYEGMFKIFQDANGNGIPDFLEGDIAKNVAAALTNEVRYNGRVFSNLDELPPEAREKVKAAVVKLNTLGLIAGTPPAQAKPPAFEPAFQPSKPLLQSEPAIQESGGKNWMLILGFLAAALICAVALALGAFFLR
ncbi:MAG: hypothetical protein JETCAE02_11240 [Anaerolineaceae bacterium]|jgi:hypothetical protein|nr:hypothetical protein [Anaerolineae bacterium]MBL1172480.1 hypothetical protein [Chloroflexota bacterium]MBV6465952.1 hypothetical protein [Anaerolineales bacterium]MCE7906558.1 hypothetical protein [Anaerolineae bacterium CFX3]MDL1925102.1 hypothetical protein [Anaerolineae bacterium AMX1]OQY83440.1 MAG: hypothetical protein B6D40_07045 [Anaerolineae bacterium UTCFX3]GER78112.1 conserved hypothetical protein [Candidatus Denitrolinea symbiosum]GJQ38712.1 MAG: hypothetical protein JETCAE02_